MGLIQFDVLASHLDTSWNNCRSACHKGGHSFCLIKDLSSWLFASLCREQLGGSRHRDDGGLGLSRVGVLQSALQRRQTTQVLKVCAEECSRWIMDFKLGKEGRKRCGGVCEKNRISELSASGRLEIME